MGRSLRKKQPLATDDAPDRGKRKVNIFLCECLSDFFSPYLWFRQAKFPNEIYDFLWHVRLAIFSWTPGTVFERERVERIKPLRPTRERARGNAKSSACFLNVPTVLDCMEKPLKSLSPCSASFHPK